MMSNVLDLRAGPTGSAADPRPTARGLVAATAGVIALLLGACADTGLTTGSLTVSGAVDAADVDNGARPALSVADAQRAYLADKTSPMAARDYAEALKHSGDKKRALAQLEKAIALDPGSAALASEIGRLAVDLGDLDKAEKSLRLAADPAKPEWRVLSAMGALHARRGELDDAKAKLDAALILAPEEPSVLNNLGLVHILDGHPERAEPLLRQAAASGNASKRIRANLALALGLQGKFDDARQVSGGVLPDRSIERNATYLRQLLKTNASEASTAG